LRATAWILRDAAEFADSADAAQVDSLRARRRMKTTNPIATMGTASQIVSHIALSP